MDWTTEAAVIKRLKRSDRPSPNAAIGFPRQNGQPRDVHGPRGSRRWSDCCLRSSSCQMDLAAICIYKVLPAPHPSRVGWLPDICSFHFKHAGQWPRVDGPRAGSILEASAEAGRLGHGGCFSIPVTRALGRSRVDRATLRTGPLRRVSRRVSVAFPDRGEGVTEDQK
jgi:hypothetical protein